MQLQIIKALLTIVTSPYISVHEGTVLLTIRTVYNMYLAGNSSTNSSTAKGTLSQMLNVIYTRMESEEAEKASLEQQRIKLDEENVSESTEAQEKNLEEEINGLDSTTELDSDTVPDVSVEKTASDVDIETNEPEHSAPSPPHSENENTQMESQCQITTVDSPCENPANESEDASPVVEAEFNEPDIPPEQEEPQVTTNGRSSPTDSNLSVLVGDNESLEISTAINTPSENSNSSQTPTSNTLPNPVPSFNHVLQKDAFLIFRALCKLSMKPLPENSPGDPK